jgi:hypothetical protein
MAGKNAPTVAKRMKKYWTKESENKWNQEEWQSWLPTYAELRLVKMHRPLQKLK